MDLCGPGLLVPSPECPRKKSKHESTSSSTHFVSHSQFEISSRSSRLPSKRDFKFAFTWQNRAFFSALASNSFKVLGCFQFLHLLQISFISPVLKGIYHSLKPAILFHGTVEQSKSDVVFQVFPSSRGRAWVIFAHSRACLVQICVVCCICPPNVCFAHVDGVFFEVAWGFCGWLVGCFDPFRPHFPGLRALQGPHCPTRWMATSRSRREFQLLHSKPRGFAAASFGPSRREESAEGSLEGGRQKPFFHLLK